MKNECIFRVQYADDMWRVLKSVQPDDDGRYMYRVVRNRCVYERFRQTSERRAIEYCLRYALGCGVDVWWGETL